MMQRLRESGWIEPGNREARGATPVSRPRGRTLWFVPISTGEVRKAKHMNSFWDFLWLLFWSYILVAYLVLLFHIFGDIFRDRDLGGFAKALWTIALIFFPFLMALIYLIARGRGMAERQAGAMRKAQADT